MIITKLELQGDVPGITVLITRHDRKYSITITKLCRIHIQESYEVRQIACQIAKAIYKAPQTNEEVTKIYEAIILVQDSVTICE